MPFLTQQRVTRTEGQTLGRDRPLATSHISGSVESQWTAKRVCDKDADVFTDTLAGSVIRLPAACIRLSNYGALSCRARRHSPGEIQDIVSQLERLQRNQIIEPSCSPFAANCILVPKKNGKQRLIVNYIPLNRVAIRDQYPLPLLSDIMGCLSGKKVFSTLDATEGFHQIELDQKSREFTAFITPIGLYQYRRVPFGFINSPAIFQRAINEILRPGLFSKCVAYVDDILIFGKDAQEHDRNLQWVLDRCRMFNLKINPSKCQIGKTSIVFLGRKISEKGMELIEPDSDVLDPSAQPKTKSEVRAILGSLQFLARFIPRFSEITKPLVNLTRKDATFQWNQVHGKHCKQPGQP